MWNTFSILSSTANADQINALESPRSKKLSSKPQVRDCPRVTFDGYWNNKAANHLVFDGTNDLKRDEIEHVGGNILSNKIESLASPIPDPSEWKLETSNRTGSLVRRCLFFGLNASHMFAYIVWFIPFASAYISRFERIIYPIQCIALFGKNHNQPSLAQRHPKINFPPLYGAQVAVVLQCPFANLHFFYLNSRLHHGVHRGNWLKSTINIGWISLDFSNQRQMFDLTLLNLAYHWVCCTALPNKIPWPFPSHSIGIIIPRWNSIYAVPGKPWLCNEF